MSPPIDNWIVRIEPWYLRNDGMPKGVDEVQGDLFLVQPGLENHKTHLLCDGIRGEGPTINHLHQNGDNLCDNENI